MENFRIICLAAWILLCPLTAIDASPSDEVIARGGARAGGGRVGGGAVGRPGGVARPIQRTPSYSRTGVGVGAVAGYRAGYNTGASSGYYYPSEPYYYYPTTPSNQNSPYALPNYNPV